MLKGLIFIMRKLALLALVLLICVSCVKKVPPAQPFDAEKSFAKANEKIEKKQYDEARKLLQGVRRKDTSMEYAPLAQLRLADTHVSEEEPELAIDEYRRFLQDYPRHKYASYAQYQIAIIYYNLIVGPDRGFGAALRALEEFEKLMYVYPRNPYRDTVLVKMQRCRDVIADHEYMVGTFYFDKKAYNGALGRLKGLLEDFPDYEMGDMVLFQLAVSYKGIGEDGKADEHLDRLRQRYPGSMLIEKAEREFETITAKRIKDGTED
jgi:outer membrane protein assembly factor BamD